MQKIKLRVVEMAENVIDPFGTSVVYDYERIFKEMGLKRIDQSILSKIKRPSRFLRRGIDFAHIDFDKFIEASRTKRDIAVMTGMKPTNEFHLGSKMAADKIIYFQKEFGAKVFYAAADIEGMIDNGLSLEKQHAIAVDNVADLLALGLDAKNAYIYKQSEQIEVLRMAYTFSRRVTNNHLINLYGERPFGLYFAALTQCGDMLLPQLPNYGGHKMVLVPVGVDQAPHIFLCRDIVEKVRDFHNFQPVAGIFHKFFRSLKGESKMSKREPMSMLTLNDSPEIATKKIMNALTGGRKTVEEQRRLGGELEKSVVFELYKYHFVDDDEKVEQVAGDYVSGKLLDGEMKKEIAEIVVKFLEKHQTKKKKLIPKARKILVE